MGAAVGAVVRGVERIRKSPPADHSTELEWECEEPIGTKKQYQ